MSSAKWWHFCLDLNMFNVENHQLSKLIASNCFTYLSFRRSLLLCSTKSHRVMFKLNPWYIAIVFFFLALVLYHNLWPYSWACVHLQNIGYVKNSFYLLMHTIIVTVNNCGSMEMFRGEVRIHIWKSKDYVYGIWVYKVLCIWKCYYRVKKIISFMHETVNRGKK